MPLKTFKRVGNSFLNINLWSIYSVALNIYFPTCSIAKNRADVIRQRSGSLKLDLYESKGLALCDSKSCLE